MEHGSLAPNEAREIELSAPRTALTAAEAVALVETSGGGTEQPLSREEVAIYGRGDDDKGPTSAAVHEPKPSAEALDVRTPAPAAATAPCAGCNALPKVEVRYNLNHSVKVRKGRRNDKPPNVFSLMGEIGHSVMHSIYRRTAGTSSPPGADGTEDFDEERFFKLNILDGMRGVLRPGRPTALLAAPGAGTSTFLRLLTGREDLQATDVLTYNGATTAEVEAAGINLKRFSSFCADFEAHEPLLTTLETFEFAHKCLNARSMPKKARKATTAPAAVAPPAPAAIEEEHCEWCTAKAPEEMLRILDLDEARATYVGSGMIRGVSGGQKRRVTIGETLLQNSRILALDLATSGLDAATAYKTCKWITNFAKHTGGIAIMSLQQPTVETFLLFSDALLLSEGREIYHGPVEHLEPYLNSLGFVRPRFLDIADYASELVADPIRAAELSINDRLDKAMTELYGDHSGNGDAHAAAATSEEEAGKRRKRVISGIGGADAAKEGVFGDEAATEAKAISQAAQPQAAPPTEAQHRPKLMAADLQAIDGFPLPTMMTIKELSDYWRSSPSGISLLYDGRSESKRRVFSPVTKMIDASDSTTQDVGGATTANIVLVVPSLLTAAPSPVHGSQQLVGPPTAPSQQRAPSATIKHQQGPKDVNDYVYSNESAATMAKGKLEKGIVLVSEEDKFHYGFQNSPTPIQQARLTIGRQLTLNRRNKGYVLARWVNALLMGIILGTVALNPPLSNAPLRIGLSLYSVIFVSFANSAEMPVILNSRSVVYKQTAAGFYSPFAYIAGAIIGTLPVAIIADLIFSNLVYWMTGFAPEFDNYLFYFLVLVSMDLLVAAIFRCMMLSGQKQDASQAVGMAVISIFMLSSGFFIIRSQLPPWLQWLPWLSFFWYAISSLANNEFHATRWNTPSPQNPSQTVGQVFLAQYSIPYSRTLQWLGVVYILSLWILVGWILSPLALTAFRFDRFPGTIRRTIIAHPDPESVLVTTGVVTLPESAEVAPPSPSIEKPVPTAMPQAPTAARGSVAPPSAIEAPQQTTVHESCGTASTRSGSRHFSGVEDSSSGTGFAPSGGSGPTGGDISGAFGNCGLPAVAGTGSGATLPAPSASSGGGLDEGGVHPLSRQTSRGQSSGGDLTKGAASAASMERESGVNLAEGQLHTRAGPAVQQREGLGSDVADANDYQLTSAGGGAAGDFARQETHTTATQAAGGGASDTAVPHPTGPPSRPPGAPSTTTARTSTPAAVAPLPPPIVDFPKVAIAFKNVSYWVQTKNGERQLLHDVSGYALPYTTTALMGASGAGKSTLLDCLLGRKTMGRMTGDITMNGVKVNKPLLQSLTAFAEQDDVHLPTLTVEESLLFSAKLRMPRGVSTKQRDAALTRIARVLELDTISKRLVGTLSKNELKRVTIGVELSKLPSIVACDEPTSFLSANNAAVVVRALRRVAKTGRTVIATIHRKFA
jgi:ABC-type multidrug transport system ATPase subunit/ABC-type multidrug transport system permease subunit